GLGRDCVVVALGGGVTTDLGGFVAGTFMRGVPWIALPTSLLAAVDASIGGKTGVDTTRGKNLIGVFHQPLVVLIDLRLISSLPKEEVDNGLAEMVKHALIADAGYLQQLVTDSEGLRHLDPGALEQSIVKSIEIKGAVVAADTQERDYRQVLNLGHTIGHALETVTEYEVSHGLAVAVGLSVECGIATRLGLMTSDARDEARAALEQLGLPIAAPEGIAAEALLGATKLDKKGRAGKARYALPVAIGQMSKTEQGYASEVPDDVVLAAISEM
ncbi:MAG: 3-dehydroquinate synthase, partial [Deltaproteobacteria bacterium]|nr:3-dehydroquinate synthase [Deltaproteobacteria bacterium]